MSIINDKNFKLKLKPKLQLHCITDNYEGRPKQDGNRNIMLH